MQLAHDLIIMWVMLSTHDSGRKAHHAVGAFAQHPVISINTLDNADVLRSNPDILPERSRNCQKLIRSNWPASVSDITLFWSGALTADVQSAFSMWLTYGCGMLQVQPTSLCINDVGGDWQIALNWGLVGKLAVMKWLSIFSRVQHLVCCAELLCSVCGLTVPAGNVLPVADQISSCFE